MYLNLLSPLLVNTENQISDRYRLFEVQIYQISVELKNPYWYTSRRGIVLRFSVEQDL